MQAYNEELEALNSPTWFNVPWLFAECYMYRYGLAGNPLTSPSQPPNSTS